MGIFSWYYNNRVLYFLLHAPLSVDGVSSSSKETLARITENM